MLQGMNIAALFIRRPVATALIMLGMLFFRAASYVNLPVNQLPNVDFPTIQVSADLSGADPETMAASVATPLEKEFFTIAGIDSISSVNATGRTRITIQFALDRDIDAAALDVQAAIGLAQRRLPTNMTNDPSFRKVNPADYPILYLRVGSPTPAAVRAQRICRYPGGAAAFHGQGCGPGGHLRAEEIRRARARGPRRPGQPRAGHRRGGRCRERRQQQAAHGLAGRGAARQRHQGLGPAGERRGLSGRGGGLSQRRAGAPFDIGEVVDSVEQDKQLSWADNGKPCIMLAVERQPGANTVQVVDDIKALLPGLVRQLPPSGQSGDLL